MADQPQYYDDEIDLREMIKVLFKRKKLVILVFLLVFLSVVSYTFLVEPLYKSETIVRIAQTEKDTLISTEEAVRQIQSSKILEPVAIKTDQPLKKLRSSITVEPIRGTNLLKLSFEHKDPELIVRVLEKVGQEFIDKNWSLYKIKIDLLEDQIQNIQSRKHQIETEIATLREIASLDSESPLIQNALANYEKVYSDLSSQIYTLKNQKASVREFEFFSLPTVPESPIKPNKKLNIAVGGVLGLMLAVFLAYFVEFWKKEEK